MILKVTLERRSEGCTIHLEDVLRTSQEACCGINFLFVLCYYYSWAFSVSVSLPSSPSHSFPFSPSFSLSHFSHKMLCRCDSSLTTHSVTDNFVYVLEQIHSYRKFISCNQEVLVSDHSSYLEELRRTGEDLAGLHTVKAEERVTEALQKREILCLSLSVLPLMIFRCRNSFCGQTRAEAENNSIN